MRSSCNKQYSSSSNDTPPAGATSSSNSSSNSSMASPAQQQQQQHAASAFSTSPDAFTAHLQSKTEADVFQLLEKARAAKLAEAAAAAKAAAKAAAGTVDGGGDANAAFAAADAELEGGELEDDTVDVVNPETGEVSLEVFMGVFMGGRGERVVAGCASRTWVCARAGKASMEAISSMWRRSVCSCRC